MKLWSSSNKRAKKKHKYEHNRYEKDTLIQEHREMKKKETTFILTSHNKLISEQRTSNTFCTSVLCRENYIPLRQILQFYLGR